MAIMDEVKGNAVIGIFIGIGAAILAPVVLPILANIARPLAKGAIKGGVMLYEKGKESMSEAGEMFEDLVAEVKSELTEEQMAAMAAAVPGVDATGTGQTPASPENVKVKKTHSKNEATA